MNQMLQYVAFEIGNVPHIPPFRDRGAFDAPSEQEHICSLDDVVTSLTELLQ